MTVFRTWSQSSALRSCRSVTALEPRPSAQVECLCTAVFEKPRDPLALWQTPGSLSDDLLVVCSWCQRVRVDARWLDAEEAVARLQLFDRLHLPRMTHTICEACEAAALRQLHLPTR